MSLLTLELKNESDLELFVTFAKRLNAIVLDIKKNRLDESQSPFYLLDKLVSKGGIKSITDPLAWQKEIRTDKPLFNRE